MSEIASAIYRLARSAAIDRMKVLFLLKGTHMKRPFSACITLEGKWFVAQCLEVDVASQGRTEKEALVNLREALELHFAPPRATLLPLLKKVEAEISAA